MKRNQEQRTRFIYTASFHNTFVWNCKSRNARASICSPILKKITRQDKKQNHIHAFIFRNIFKILAITSNVYFSTHIHVINHPAPYLLQLSFINAYTTLGKAPNSTYVVSFSLNGVGPVAFMSIKLSRSRNSW